MDQNKLESLLTAINREQRLRSDLEVQVSHERQRLQVNNKYIATLMQEKDQKVMELREAECQEKELRFGVNPQLEHEVALERESRSSMQVTISALQAKKSELTQRLTNLRQNSRRDVADRAARLKLTPEVALIDSVSSTHNIMVE